MVVRSNAFTESSVRPAPFQGLVRLAGVFLFYVVLFLLISLISQPGGWPAGSPDPVQSGVNRGK